MLILTAEQTAKLAQLQAEYEEVDPGFGAVFHADGKINRYITSIFLPEMIRRRQSHAQPEPQGANDMSTTVAPAATTMRQRAHEAVLGQVHEYLGKSHKRGYWALYVESDGTVRWVEQQNQSDGLLYTDRYRHTRIAQIAVVGTGDQFCECSFCADIYDPDLEADALARGEEYDLDETYATQDDAISDAVSFQYDDDLAIEFITDGFEERLRDIKHGYFDDEDDDDEVEVDEA